MARDFPSDTAATEYGFYSTSEQIQAQVDGASIISVAALVQPASFAVRTTIFRTHNSAGTNLTLRFETSGAVRMAGRSTTSDSFTTATTTSTGTAGTWMYVGGVMKFGATTRIEAYLNGVGQGSSSPSWGSSTFVAGSNADFYDSIGGISRASGLLEPEEIGGALDYIVIWADVDLETIGGFQALANGAHPYNISPDKIVYAPIMRGSGGVACPFSGVTLTQDSANTYAEVEGRLSTLSTPWTVNYTPAAGGVTWPHNPFGHPFAGPFGGPIAG